MAPLENDWRPIAEQVSTEMDSAKLMDLVAQLCSALDAQQSQRLSPTQLAFAAD